LAPDLVEQDPRLLLRLKLAVAAVGLAGVRGTLEVPVDVWAEIDASLRLHLLPGDGLAKNSLRLDEFDANYDL
jgi:hypothetical protein